MMPIAEAESFESTKLYRLRPEGGSLRAECFAVDLNRSSRVLLAQ
jgi:hypothetical protein